MLDKILRNLMVSFSVVAKLRLWKCQLVMGKNLQVEMKPRASSSLLFRFGTGNPTMKLRSCLALVICNVQFAICVCS